MPQGTRIRTTARLRRFGAAGAALSLAALLAACGGLEPLLLEIGRNFTSQAPALLSTVREAIRDQDASRLHGAAHKLYGTITAFSTVAGRVASELEDLAALGRLADAPPLIETLEAMVDALIREVNGLSVEALRSRADAVAGSSRAGPP